VPFFGEIINDKMNLSPIGVIANVLWYEIKNHFKNCELGEFVVMPDHLHGLLILKNEKNDIQTSINELNFQEDSLCIMENQRNEFMSKISPKSKSISTIIRSYKSAVSKHTNRLSLDFSWQPLFYDHIVRNDEAFHRISKYIKDNPLNWSLKKKGIKT
jgi:REP element-mobilizing transposase RayT